MDKRLITPQNVDGRRDIFFVQEDRHYLRKHAGGYHPLIQQYIEKAKPVDNLIQVLLTALGSFEHWGQNVNGDRFREAVLKHEGNDYGYQTFLTNANYFTHHVNKDPALAKGKVLHSVWNDAAKRVELIVGINPELDPDAARMIADGENLCFSMGAKLPFDVCSVCANAAKTRAEYCDHLKYMMGQIDPASGLLVGADNPFPKFFDISRVLIPADKTAYMWEKLAAGSSPLLKMSSAEIADLPAGKLADMQYLQEKVAAREEDRRSKVATVSKKAEIHKQITANVETEATRKLNKAFLLAKQALDASSPDIPVSTFKGFSLPEILSTMLYLGMVPKHEEFQSLWDVFVGEEGHFSPSSIGGHNVSEVLAQRLSTYVPERSFAAPILARRILIIAKKPVLKKQAGLDMKAGLATGVIAALGAILGGSSSGLMKFVADHPLLTAILVGTGIKMARTAGDPGSHVVSGNFTVADPTQGFYNTDWQRRFIELQNHPVAVIKTGAALRYDALLTPASVAIMCADMPVELYAATDFSKEASEDALYRLKEVSKYSADLLKQAEKMGFDPKLDNPDLMELFPELAEVVIVKKALELQN